MKKRMISVFLALALLLATVPGALGAGFTDTYDHWAKNDIENAVSLGLFSGVSETRFAPDAYMTRGMFLTVLGRIETIDRQFWSEDKPQVFEDVSPEAYYAPYITWAACNGIADGTGDNVFQPEAPITREQIAKLLVNYVTRMGHTLVPLKNTQIPSAFADGSRIAPWASDAVDLLRTIGILNGYADETGGVSFQPQNYLTRGECAAVFCRLFNALVKGDRATPAPTAVSLNQSGITLSPGGSYQLKATTSPSRASLVWRSTDTAVVRVDSSGLVTYEGPGAATVRVYTENGLTASCYVVCKADLAGDGETKEEKCIRLFGKVVEDPRLYYSTGQVNGVYLFDYNAAEADMQRVTLRVWDIGTNGQKYTKKLTIQVHKNLAATVKAIFEEIYNGEEKFPIHSIGGFSRGGRSEHTIGTAIDINPNENYYCDPNGNAIVGSYWKPGEDPYSIPLDGEVAGIFAKYGFTQGAYWRSGYRDYMHFSYFGT